LFNLGAADVRHNGEPMWLTQSTTKLKRISPKTYTPQKSVSLYFVSTKMLVCI